MAWLIFLHRYIGIAIGWLIVLWCVSGVVMMYVPYPSVSFDEHIEALEELSLAECCAVDSELFDSPFLNPQSFSIEMHGGEPTLTVTEGFGSRWRVGLVDAELVGPISAEDAVAISASRTAHWADRGEVEYRGELVRDQWTVGYYRPGQILHHVALNDGLGSEWYLDASNGELIQATTRRERGWNWIGSVAHWIYPTFLRQRGPLWSNIVIWSTIVGIFLTVIGTYIGVMRLRFRHAPSLSPFRGVTLWHHYLGLAFGILTLTWLVSGLASMNPWGWLAPSGARNETENIRDFVIGGGVLRDVLSRLDELELPPGVTYLRSAPLLGELFLIAYDRNGNAVRYATETMQPQALLAAGAVDGTLDRVARRLLPDVDIVSAELIERPDAFYYDHHTERSWPAYRVIYADAARTRYYLDTISGDILRKFDATQRSYRWWFSALHQLDFAAMMRARPVWDIVMIALLGGVALVSGTGTYMGIRYLARRRRA